MVRRALPLSLSALLGIVGHAALYEDWATAAACYIGYLCLLRTREILTLKVQHVVHYEESGKSVLCLPDSKGAKRKDVSECVGPRPGRKTTPADHDGRQELGRRGSRGPLLHVVFARRRRRWASMMRACLVTVSGVAAPRSISHGSLPWMQLRLMDVGSSQARHESTSNCSSTPQRTKETSSFRSFACMFSLSFLQLLKHLQTIA